MPTRLLPALSLLLPALFLAGCATVSRPLPAAVATASLSVLGYDHDLTEPVIHAWNIPGTET